jgi:hypothetical protein
MDSSPEGGLFCFTETYGIETALLAPLRKRGLVEARIFVI